MPMYYAKSVLESKTLWFNLASFLVAAAEMTEVANIIPEAWEGRTLAIVALVNLALRMFSTRPVAMVGPGETKAISVEALPTPQ